MSWDTISRFEIFKPTFGFYRRPSKWSPLTQLSQVFVSESQWFSTSPPSRPWHIISSGTNPAWQWGRRVRKGRYHQRKFKKRCSPQPIPSMYGIFPYIYQKNQPNVGIYIYMWYGLLGSISFPWLHTSSRYITGTHNSFPWNPSYA